MKTIQKLNLFFIFFACTSSLAISQEVYVKDIVNNSTAYEGELVEVEGIVQQYIEASESTTAHYLLRDDYGAIIRVNTAEGEPETNVKYKTRGIVYINQTRNEPFISEKSRIKLQVEPETTINYITPEKNWLEQNFLYIIIGAGLILLVLIIILFTSRRSSKSYIPPAATATSPAASGISTPSSKAVVKEDLKTMVIPKPSSKTMKFIPGELEVISGQDKGRKIKIAGYATEEGSVVTIGRETISGPRDYAHIELKERTISRKQAELIYRDGKLFIKNLSGTNFTRMNGEEIAENASLELKKDSIITLGEVELKYNHSS